jgi:hypothetical protein
MVMIFSSVATKSGKRQNPCSKITFTDAINGMRIRKNNIFLKEMRPIFWKFQRELKMLLKT